MRNRGAVSRLATGRARRTDPPSGGLFPISGYGGCVVVKRVLLASPRGYCAGVERAVETVERALALYGAPVYVRKQIVHNSHVVHDLEAAGAVFVDDERDAPEGATLVLSAHGVAPAVFDRAAARRLTT